jgi:uncharacterized protein YggE
MEAVLEALREAGVDGDDIQTSNFSVCAHIRRHATRPDPVHPVIANT